MEPPQVFKSTSTDTSFPWLVSVTTLVLSWGTNLLWAWSVDKSNASIWLWYACGGAAALGLGLFIRWIRVACTRPVAVVNAEGIQLGGLIDVGVIPWNRLLGVVRYQAEIPKLGRRDCLGIKVADLTEWASVKGVGLRGWWRFVQFMTIECRRGHTFVIVDAQLVDGMDALVEAIRHHVRVDDQSALG